MNVKSLISALVLVAAALIQSAAIAETAFWTTTATSDGDIASGGDARTNADAFCNADAQASNFATTHAFLSVGSTDSIANMPTNYGFPANEPIVRPDGTVIAATWADFLAGTLSNSTTGVAEAYWTGGVDGTSFSNCAGWTSNFFNDLGVIGAGSVTTIEAVDASPVGCAGKGVVLACVSVVTPAAATPTPVPSLGFYGLALLGLGLAALARQTLRNKA